MQRIYREVEEPMLNATRDQFNQNPFAALANNSNTSEANRQAGTENTQPLPNPWGGSAGANGANAPNRAPAANANSNATMNRIISSMLAQQTGIHQSTKTEIGRN